MRLLLVFVISSFCYVVSKNVKTLSDTQEVIEIAGPKELPPGLEEEPAGEMDDDDDIKSSAATTTKKDKKTTSAVDARKKLKDVEKIDGMFPEDEEARLEKELAEIYKDTGYTDSAEDTSDSKEVTTTETTTVSSTDEDKPIGRQRNNFKFAPDSTNKKDVDRFRTSVDDISCKNNKKLSGHTPIRPMKDPVPDSAQRVFEGSISTINACRMILNKKNHLVTD